MLSEKQKKSIKKWDNEHPELRRKYRRNWYRKNKKYFKNYYKSHKKQMLNSMKKYQKNNKNKIYVNYIKPYQQKWRKKNKLKIQEYNRIYYTQRKELQNVN